MIDRSGPVWYGGSRITDYDVFLFKEGNHFRLFERLGSHPGEIEGRGGVHFAVWAPDAEAVCVMGDFNEWNAGAHPLSVRLDASGIWEGFIPGLGHGERYKYHVRSRYRAFREDKGDPYAFRWEEAPGTASVVWDLAYEWDDGDWMNDRQDRNALDAPLSIYEVHLGSWRRVPEEGNRFLTYRELAHRLGDYVQEMGFTHVELLPVMEHPFYGSWGYQTVGFFAPTSRYGTPQDFMYFVDQMHRRGIGVILDWVPSHFPSDAHGIAYFDGTHLYEHEDDRKGFHPEWKTYIFNYGRKEVRNFIVSSALFWLEKYHVDGLRVDAVASMLYLDYAREDGEWIPNRFGGRENLEAIECIKSLNRAAYETFPDVQTIAEESTAWPMVSRPTYVGGLGFGMKWNMGWMHDTLEYMTKDPIHRKFHHNLLTFGIWYAFHENFVLSFSHDEVVYGKGSLLGRMPGDEWRKFANLRLLYGYLYCHPGKKLLFMGGEFGQRQEWYHEESLHWHLREEPLHGGLSQWVGDLNRIYRNVPALFEDDFSPAGHQWVDSSDADNSVLSFLRKGWDPAGTVLAVFNFTPVPRYNYRVGIPTGGPWREILNSDAVIYGGSGQGNAGSVEAVPIPSHGFYNSLVLTVPPLGCAIFSRQT